MLSQTIQVKTSSITSEESFQLQVYPAVNGGIRLWLQICRTFTTRRPYPMSLSLIRLLADAANDESGKTPPHAGGGEQWQAMPTCMEACSGTAALPPSLLGPERLSAKSDAKSSPYVSCCSWRFPPEVSRRFPTVDTKHPIATSHLPFPIN